MTKLPEGFFLYTASTGEKIDLSDDVLAIVGEKDFFVSGMFTQNVFAGSPVIVSKSRLKNSPHARCILVNSGIANVATGKKGIQDAEKCAEILSKKIHCDSQKILVSSTGKIGEFLPVNKIKRAIESIDFSQISENSVEQGARAIMTTDTVPKYISVQCGDGTITGIAKGVGMIEPNMATMLAFVMTDINISEEKISQIWKNVVDKTFNMVSVDACESTSDMALLCVNKKFHSSEEEFTQKIFEVCEYLTKSIARDGEGATILLSVECKNVHSEENAKILSKSVINSPLVKCAMHGKDLNWGRIMQAIGSTHIHFDPQKIELFINDVCVFARNIPQKISQEQEAFIFSKSEIAIVIDFHQDKEFSAIAWGCDLSKEYVKINAEYRT